MGKQSKKQKSKMTFKNPINLVLLILFMVILAILAYRIINKPPVINQTSQKIVTSRPKQLTEPAKTKLKTFTGEQFKTLYNNFAYPNTHYIIDNSVITDDSEVDLYIQNFAEAMGYKRRSAPVVDVFKEIDGNKIQQRAHDDWLSMKDDALKSNLKLMIVAGYRSQSDQKELFLSRLKINRANYKLILTGSLDRLLKETLDTTAIPGYSRHHNGYTVDISCGGEFRAFQFTSCFAWLSKNNYENTKKHGWIPSYPEETVNQGPEPETWEYVWVGKDAVLE